LLFQGSFKPLTLDGEGSKLLGSPAAILGALAPLVLVPAQEAMAKGGEYGVLEGRSFAFIHPISMGESNSLRLHASPKILN